MLKPRISVVVVSYNTAEKLCRCLSCLADQHEIIVVDNASVDGSADRVATEYPHVNLVRSDVNLGFGAANNRGAALATGDFILFLNSDAYADPGAIDLLAREFGPGVSALGGRLLNPDRSLQSSTANRLTLWAVFCEQSLLEKLAPNTFLSPYWTTQKWADSRSPVETAQVMGACLMVRNPSPERWDERYFLYCEDTDLCLRLSRHGRILYVPEATFVHDLGSSSLRNRWLAVARYNRGKETYFRIHHGALASTACWLLNRLGALLRLAIWTLLIPLRGPDQAQLFLRVLFARGDLR
ncbi:MAG: glycosyltransferase family 2 protein [Fimbriimonas sp.]